jgi:hypothetical protein
VRVAFLETIRLQRAGFVALASELLVVAEALRMPLSLREIGSSAGLNLRLDRYWYEEDSVGWGDASSAVRFVDLWNGGAPPFASGVAITDRRGCDRDPIDATSSDGAFTLLSYIWPQPPETYFPAGLGWSWNGPRWAHRKGRHRSA